MNDPLALSRAVARDHKERAEARARAYAAKFKTPVFIFRAWKKRGYWGGLVIDTQAPVIGEYWQVSPSGQIERKDNV